MRIAKIAAILVVFLTGLAQADTITVCWDGGGDFTTIQAGINDANDGDEVVVCEGTYYENIIITNRDITLTCADRTNPNTVEETIIDGNNLDSVIKINDSNVVIYGFTITNGLADSGGGVYCSGGPADVCISNCHISNNKTTDGNDGYCVFLDPDFECFPGEPGGDGAGIYCCNSISLTVIASVISNNTTGQGGDGTYMDFWWSLPADGGDGGGIYCSSPSLNIKHCIFQNNTTGDGGYQRFGGGDGGRGGGIYCTSPSATIHRCRFINNATGNAGAFDAIDTPGPTGGDGGGIFCSGSSSPDIRNCLVEDNTTGGWTTPEEMTPSLDKSGDGAGIYCSDANITNCTIVNNEIGDSNLGGYGGGVYCNAATTIENCISWDNNAPNYPQIYANPTVTYSNIEGGWSGPGNHNIDADPCFVSGSLGDYYLSQTAAGQASNSPCVDAGSDSSENLGMDILTTRTDRLGDTGVVDMGYHYAINTADLNGDGKTNIIDIRILTLQWLQEPNVPPADIAPEGGDNIVNFQDFVFMAAHWLEDYL